MAEHTDEKRRTAFASMSGGFLSMPRPDQGPETLRDLGGHLLRPIDPGAQAARVSPVSRGR